MPAVSRLAAASQTVHYLLGFAALTTAARMLVGATSSLYLVSKGIAPEHIIYLKVVQAGLIMVLEVPLGMAADFFSRRTVIIAGGVCTVAWLVITASATSALPLYIGEAFNAIALATFSGAIEAELSRIWQESRPDKMHELFIKQTTWSFTATSVAALAGGLIARPGSSIPWWWAAGSMAMLVLTFALIYRPGRRDRRASQAERASTQFGQILGVTLREMRRDGRSVLNAVLAAGFLAAGFQVVIQYWQLLIPETGLGRVTGFFGLAFFLIILVQSRTKTISAILMRSRVWYVVAGVVPPVLIVLAVACTHSPILIVLTLCLYFWCYQGSMVDLNASIAGGVDNDIRATVFSIRSALTRIAVIGTAPLVSLAVAQFGILGAVACAGMCAVAAVVLVHSGGVYATMQRNRTPVAA